MTHVTVSLACVCMCSFSESFFFSLEREKERERERAKKRKKRREQGCQKARNGKRERERTRERERQGERKKEDEQNLKALKSKEVTEGEREPYASLLFYCHLQSKRRASGDSLIVDYIRFKLDSRWSRLYAREEDKFVY